MSAVAGERVPVSTVIESLPFKLTVQGKIYLVGALGYMFDAWDVLLPGFVLPLLIPAMHLNVAASAAFASAGLAGMAIGAFGWGTVADVLGRKNAFTVTLIAYGLFSVLCAAAPNITFLLVARFLAGIGLGGCIPVDYAIVTEFMPRKWRGPLVTSVDSWWTIGGVLNSLIAVALLQFNNWRLMFLVMVLPILLVAWVRFSVPESPVWLARKGRDREARQIVDKLVTDTNAVSRQYYFPTENEERTGVREMLSKLPGLFRYNWKGTLGLWLFFGIFYTEYFGVLNFMPTILVQHGYKTYSAFLFGTLLLGTEFFATIVAALIVNLTGRKWPMVVGGVVSAFCIVILTANLNAPVVARAAIVGFGFFNGVAAAINYVYAPEMYPTLLRGSGFGWASTISRISAALIPFTFATLLWPIFGLTATFLITFAVMLVVSVYFMLANPETTNRPIDATEPGAEAVPVLRDAELRPGMEG